MKSQKTILQILLFFTVIFIAAKSDVFAQEPIVIKIVEKPAVLRSGQTYTFAFEVQNVTDAPLTLSSDCAASVNIIWINRNGTGGGTGAGCYSSHFVADTDYNPETKKFSCITRQVPYTKDDFFTLQPNETKRFEDEVNVPDTLKPRFVTVVISYESKHDGSAVGLQAWKGAKSSVSLKMRVVK